MAAESETKAVKSGVWFTACSFITKSIGFLTTPIFTRLLTKAEFGDYNNFSTWLGIGVIITSLNLEASIIRARFDFEDDMDTYVRSMMTLSMISTAVWLGIVLCFKPTVEKLMLLSQREIYAMFIYLFFYPTIQLFQTKERFQYRYKSTVLISLAIAIGTSALSVILVLLMPDRLWGRVLGSVLPIAMIGLSIFFIIFHRRQEIKISYWKYAIPFTLPFIPHLLSMYLLGSMDKVMIKQMCGAEDLALYSLAYTVGTIISIFVTSMNNAFSPWLGEHLAKNEFEKIKKVTVPYVASFVVLSFTVVLIAPEALLIMGGKAYSSVKNIMPPIMAGCLMQFIYCMYVNVEQFYKKTVGMAIASTFAALFNYITNRIFIERFGFVAAAYTTFASYLILMLIHLFLVKKITKEPVYKNKTILLIGALGSVALISMQILYRHDIIRYLVFIFMVVGLICVGIRKKDLINNFIRKGR